MVVIPKPHVQETGLFQRTITISEGEQKSLKTYEPLPHSGMDEVYKSPIVPEAKVFQAVVSCIGSDGTIYIIPKSFGEFT